MVMNGTATEMPDGHPFSISGSAGNHFKGKTRERPHLCERAKAVMAARGNPRTDASERNSVSKGEEDERMAHATTEAVFR